MDGQAQPDTFWPEAHAVVPAMLSADLIRTVERLVAGSGAESLGTTPTVALTPTPIATAGSLDDPVIMSGLEQLVGVSSYIFIGTVTAPGEIINLARDVNDISQSDPLLFHLGQTYEVAIESYLKGRGPSTVRTVQMEGQSATGDQPAPAPTTDDEIATMKAQFGAIPLRIGQRYLFFTRSLQGFDPERGYMVTSYGHPWRFTLPDGGVARPESQYPEAIAAFPPEDSTWLVARVEELVASTP